MCPESDKAKDLIVFPGSGFAFQERLMVSLLVARSGPSPGSL